MQAHNAALKKAQKRKHANDRAKVRSEKLARRNPFRLEKQVSALQSIPEEFRSQHETKQLEELEKELRLIKKARKEMGVDEEEKPAVVKKGRDNKKAESEESDSGTDEEVRGIPMPKGPLPPLPGQEEKKQIVYEAKPILRDLRKEAARFVPTTVRRKVGEEAAVSTTSAGQAEVGDGTAASEAQKPGEEEEDELAKFERELQEVQEEVHGDEEDK